METNQELQAVTLRNTKSILKCLGGKSRLMMSLSHYFPSDLKSNKYSYIEPFIGGASPLIHMAKYEYIKLDNCYINDGNPDIANLYWTIKQNPAYFLEILNYYASHTTKEDFENFRNLFNTKYFNWMLSSNIEDSVHRSAIFLYLNKTSFNGLVRYNSSGLFNSPWGKYKNPKIYDRKEILNFSFLLKEINLNDRGSEDFDVYVRRVVENIQSSDKKIFIYMDPPYIPISVTSSFSQYTSKEFSVYDHIRIRSLLDWLTEKNCKVLISNSNCNLTKEIFKGYTTKVTYNTRSVSATNKGRGKIKELVITNY